MSDAAAGCHYRDPQQPMMVADDGVGQSPQPDARHKHPDAGCPADRGRWTGRRSSCAAMATYANNSNPVLSDRRQPSTACARPISAVWSAAARSPGRSPQSTAAAIVRAIGRYSRNTASCAAVSVRGASSVLARSSTDHTSRITAGSLTLLRMAWLGSDRVGAVADLGPLAPPCLWGGRRGRTCLPGNAHAGPTLRRRPEAPDMVVATVSG